MKFVFFERGCIPLVLALSLWLTPAYQALQLHSDAFQEGGMIPIEYTCQGGNIPPPLEWTDAPEGTKSFALIVDDPEHATAGAGFAEGSNLRGSAVGDGDGSAYHYHHHHHHNHSAWSHWILYNIPTNISSLDLSETQGRLPHGCGRHGRNDFKQNTEAYNGPCPPSNGIHKYIFTLYALDIATIEESEGCHGDHNGMRNGMTNEQHKMMSSMGNDGMGYGMGYGHEHGNHWFGRDVDIKEGAHINKRMAFDRETLERAMDGHILDQAKLTGAFEKVEK
jgi:hypothetical protein